MSAVCVTRQGLFALRVCALLGAMILSGCAGLKPQATPPARPLAELHAAHLAAISPYTHWRLLGRIAVQRENQGFSANLDWRESESDYSLRVAAPLNGGTFALTGNAAAVSLATPKGEIYRAADAESLMRQHLGWALPLAGTRYWVRGLPNPAHPVTGERLDAAGRWTDFAQDGWRVSVLEYTHTAARDLPKRLFLAHDKLQVRMAIKSWEQP